MEKILELLDITAGYDKSIVLQNVNLTVYEKDFLGIIGPNGGGKSTLLKVILGLLPPWKGKISFFGMGSERKNHGIGYLPQINIFDKKFPISVLDVVLSGLLAKRGLFKDFSKDDREKAQELLSQMGISHLQEKAIGELSGGQMQRVFLSRALISSPRLLLLDEPDTFVDSSFEISLFKILKKLNDQMAIVLVSHDIGVVASYVKNIACINKTLYYHSHNTITEEILGLYGTQCPIDIITHGEIPHRVLPKHGDS